MRQVFFSFEYNKDNWRASQVRNMGKVSNDSTFSDNDWEEVKYKSKASIEQWIKEQMKMRSCVIVLIGSTTYTRDWVKYEIQEAYNQNKGLVGIYIDKLEDRNGRQTTKGNNPFDYITTYRGEKLSKYVKTFDSAYLNSKNVYNDIANNIEDLIEDAINKAGTY